MISYKNEKFVLRSEEITLPSSRNSIDRIHNVQGIIRSMTQVIVFS